jgi:DNA-binding MarR family transcriptional regulator
MNALADRLLLKPASITGLIEHLEKQALLERLHESTDRRVVTVWLTDRGRKQAEFGPFLKSVGSSRRTNL